MPLAVRASSYEPVVDMQGDDQAKYDADLERLPRLWRRSTPKNAAGGAVAGAVFGAIIGGILLGGCGAASAHLSVRLKVGLAPELGRVVHQRAIIINCMVGRGHKVLG